MGERDPGKTWALTPFPCLAHSPWRRQRRPLVPAESITNNQSAGVDEGGIAEVHGKLLVILRGGRLFTVDVDRYQLQPVASLWGGFGHGGPAGAWGWAGRLPPALG